MSMDDKSLGALELLKSGARDLLRREIRSLKVQAGSRVFGVGDSCSNYLLLKSGSIRVSVFTESGREILLYKVEPGETCVLTVSCLMTGGAYEAEGIVETDAEAYVLPKPVFDELLASSPEFRTYVFSSYGERMHTLISLVQEISMRHVDRKLARLLVARREGGIVSMTHQAIATELNTAREVVSRLLNDFEDRGWLRLARGRIHVQEETALEIYASQV